MNSDKGFTLIEVILTIAIIGIVSISAFTIFSTGLNNIVKSGNRTDSVLQTKDKIDNKIYGREPSEGTSYEITVDIRDKNNKLIYKRVVPGEKIIESTKDEYMNDIEIETFVPVLKWL